MQYNLLHIQNKPRSFAESWLEENLVIALSVGGTSARENSSKLQAHLEREKGCVFEQRNEAKCISAELISAVWAVQRTDSAVKLRLFLNEEVPRV